MKFKMPVLLALIASCWTTFAVFQETASGQDDSGPFDIATLDIARTITAHGAEMLAAGDVEGIVDQYTETGELVSTTTHPNSRPTSTIIRGTENLRKFFKVAENLRQLAPTNVVDNARLVAPNTIYIVGTLELTGQDGKVTRIPFSQVRTLIGTAWKIVSLQVIFQGT